MLYEVITVQHLDRPRRRDHHVAGLEVAVHDPGLVRALEAVGDLTREREGLFERERALGEPRLV